MTNRPEVTEPATPSFALARRIDARLATNPQSAAFEGELVAFMRSPRIDTSHRLRAATRLLVIAEDTANPELAVLVYHDLLRIAPTDDDTRTIHDQALLIYHGAFGSRVDALRLVRRVIATAAREPHSWLGLQGRINATHALQLVGETSDLVPQLEECYEELLASSAHASCVLVASRLASGWLDIGDVETARRWTHIATSHVRSRFSDHSSSAHLSVKADLALIDGNYRAARRLISLMRSAAGSHQGGRRAMDLLIRSLRLAQCEGSAVDDADVDRLMHWHLRARGFGGHDDAMECLWIALVNQRRLTSASGLLLEYVGHYRREARPCKHFLTMRTATDPCWQLLPFPKGGACPTLEQRRASLARCNYLAVM